MRVDEGQLDLGTLSCFEGIFEPLRDPACCAEVRVHPELDAPVWPNGVDLDLEVLCAKVWGKSIEA